MKMTMNIDEELLERIMAEYGYVSKTETVEMALRELDRKARFREVGKKGLGMTPGDWENAIDYRDEPVSLRVAEEHGKYGK